jgi:hypothetical protein
VPIPVSQWPPLQIEVVLATPDSQAASYSQRNDAPQEGQVLPVEGGAPGHVVGVEPASTTSTHRPRSHA